MTIEILVYPTLAFLAVGMTAKFIERERDVLYGPYIWGRQTAFDAFSEELDAYMVALGLKRLRPLRREVRKPQHLRICDHRLTASQ